MRTLYSVLLMCAFASANVHITGSNLPSGTVDVSYAGSVSAAGGCVPYTWLVSNLPQGLTATPPATQKAIQSLAITGIPTQSGTFIFTVEVIGCGNGKATVSETLTIAGTSLPHTVTLNWIAPTTPYSYFSVYRGTVTGGPYSEIATSIDGTSYIDTDVNSGESYFYVVTDTDSTGTESVFSNEAQATVP